jgi:TIR domain
MTLGEAKELERLKAQEAVNARLKLRDDNQKEIDRTVDRRSGGWHAARAGLAFSFISDDVEDKIAIRKDMVSRCPELASPYEMKQFEEKLSSEIESGFQAVMKSLPVMGVRAPASTSEVSSRKLALSQRIHAAARMIQLEAPKPVPVTPTPIGGNTRQMPSGHRFQIAVSFPGEARARVQQIAENLTVSVPKESILYDRWLASDLARPNLDIYLTELYKKDSLLLVFFLSGHHVQKEWCGLEWRVGRDLLEQKQEQRLMPLRLDDAEIPGLHSIDGYLDIRDLSDVQVASAILERLATLN